MFVKGTFRPAERTARSWRLWNMKPSLAHLSPTVLAFAAALAASLSVFALSGAGLQGEPIPLLPALGGAAGEVAANLSGPDRRRAPAPAAARIPTRPVLVSTVRATAPRAVSHRAHRTHHARPRVPVVRPVPTPPVTVAAPAPPPAPAQAPAAPVSAPAPQPASVPKGKGKAPGHAHAGKTTVAGTNRHRNGRAGGHSPEHHRGLPPGQAKKEPAAPPKAKGGGPPAEHGGSNDHKGDKK
jgi:hypothetical protein